jgi:hypothetical protein
MRSLSAIFVAGLLVTAGPAFAQTANSSALAQDDHAVSSAANGNGQDSADDSSQDGLSAYDQTSTFPCVNSIGEAAVCTLVAGTAVVLAVLASKSGNNETTTSSPPVSSP